MSIEDDFSVRNFIQRMLPRSMELVTADRVKTGILELEKAAVEVVLLDLNLPDSAGIETFKTFHSHFPDIPIIIITSMEDECLAEEIVLLGAQDYLIKMEFDEKTLSKSIRYAIRRKETELSAKASEERFRQIAESISEIFWLTNADRTKIHYVSRAYEEIWKQKCEELYENPESWMRLIHPKDLNRVSYSLKNQTDAAYDEQYRIVIPEGSIKWVRDRSYPVQDTRGNLQMVSITTDITKYKATKERLRAHEQQLIQADKMAALGTLVSGVAHEINNPNYYIMLNAPLLFDAWQAISSIVEKHYQENGDFLIGSLPYSEMRKSIPALFKGIIDGSKRIKNIVDGLKDYARQDISALSQEVDINSVVKSAITLVENRIREMTSHFTVEYGKNMPPVKGNFQRLEQVVVNLLLNSCEALADVEQEIAIITDYDKDIGSIRVIVKDEGVGIAEDLIPQITDPFFTTKRDSGGTGLGLSVSSGIIKDHGGSLNFESFPGEGTKVTMTIPIERPYD